MTEKQETFAERLARAMAAKATSRPISSASREIAA